MFSKHGIHLPLLPSHHFASGVLWGLSGSPRLAWEEERLLSLNVYHLAFAGEIGSVIASGCWDELLDSQRLNPCWWQVRVLMTGDRTPSGVCLCQISCSSKTVFSPAVTLSLSTFGGNRRTNVPRSSNGLGSQCTLWFCHWILHLNWRHEEKITPGSVFTIKHEMRL